MPLQNFSSLTSIQLSALQEIGNIGSGNAATSLSEMLSKPVGMKVPKIRVLDFTEVTDSLGGPENTMVGVLLSLSGDVTGMMMFVLEREFTISVMEKLMGVSISSLNDLGEMGYSMIQEIANIMVCSYVNAISMLTTLQIIVSVPAVCIDMIGAILSVPAIHYANISDKIVFIEEEFHMDAENVVSHMLMIPDVESLDKIMTKLGIGI